MKGTLILGIALILMGTAILGYWQFSYQTRRTVLEVGPIKAAAERTKTVSVPPIEWTVAGSRFTRDALRRLT